MDDLYIYYLRLSKRFRTLWILQNNSKLEKNIFETKILCIVIAFSYASRVKI